MNNKLQVFQYPFRLKLGLAIIFALFLGNYSAQIQNDFLNKNITRIQLKKYFTVENANFHSAIQPYEFLDSSLTAADSEIFTNAKPSVTYCKNSDISDFQISPILFGDGQFGEGVFGESTLVNVGIKSSYGFKDKLHFRTSIFGGKYNKSSYYTKGVVPEVSGITLENGNPYYYNFNTSLTYLPSDIFALQIGKGKHKFGDGHRSLLLSNEAVNYPYAKIRTRVWNIEYINLFSAQKSFTQEPNPFYSSIYKEPVYKDKFTSSHLLSWNIKPDVNVYFFETIIWQNEDTLSTRGFDVNYLNPIIFFRPIEFSVGSSDNAIVGIGSSWKIKPNFQVYGQFVIDEMIFKRFINRTGWWANKYGAQLGFKAFDIFKTKDNYFQIEWNQVRPFTYSHGSPQQNYAHFNQALAHPAGSNFYEFLAIFVKDIKNFQFRLQSEFLLQGRDIIDFEVDDEYLNLGGDIFQSYVNPYFERGNVVGQGLTTNQLSTQLSAAYVFDRKNDGRIFLDFNYIYANIEEYNNTYTNLDSFLVQIGLSLNFK